MSEDFSVLQNKVAQGKLLLPDFQRNFVWEEEQMISLYASVLCQMPIGSYLTLKSDDKDFSCKKIGAKPKTLLVKQNDINTTEYLIDGQQRITSLFAGFSTYFFREFNANIDDIASKDLIKFYFLKIPTKTNEDLPDLFGVRTQSFDATKRKTEGIYFRSSDIKSCLCAEPIDAIFPTYASEEGKKKKKKVKLNKLPDLHDQEVLGKLESYCINPNDGFYRIPLQLFNEETNGAKIAFRHILENIVDHHIDENANDKERKDLAELWMESFKTHIKSCLTMLDLNLIEVKNSDKVRAIDIYSNLNQGGVALSVFDLVMAKVGTVYDNNYYDYLIGEIQAEHNYKKCVPEKVKNWLDQKKYNYVNAAKIAGVVNEKNNDIDKSYINIFLNVLSLYTNKLKKLAFDVSCVKQEKILALDPNDIFKNTSSVCEAIDRALFFFQTRCGIRKISDLNYKAQLSLVAFIFSDKGLWENKKVHDFLEYWYWTSIFAEMYPSNQDVSILEMIPKFVTYFQKKPKSGEYNPLDFIHENYEGKVLRKEFYSDKDTLTMSKIDMTQKYPPAKMTGYVCQYYLAQGYGDFIDNSVCLNFLYDGELEVHHIMALGSDPNKKLGATTKELRKDKKHKFNSPLNMLLITKNANRTISDMKYSEYSKVESVKNILPNVGCTVDIGASIKIEDLLENRYNALNASLLQRLNTLYGALSANSKKGK